MNIVLVRMSVRVFYHYYSRIGFLLHLKCTEAIFIHSARISQRPAHHIYDIRLTNITLQVTEHCVKETWLSSRIACLILTA